MAPVFLGARRLSVASDESTSFERQDEAISACVSAVGGSLLPEYADDYGVSASKVGPFDRKGLGEWLRRPDAYDGIVFWRLDRAVRSMADMSALGAWAKKHGKRLIFASGPGGVRLELDFKSPLSELILLIFAFAAQMESQATQERVTGARRFLPTVGRWPGGKVPFGYESGPHPELESGRWLHQHPEEGPIRVELIARVAKGEAYAHIAADFKRRKLTEGKKKTKYGWTANKVRKLATEDTARGRAIHDGRTVRDAEGRPVLWGDALVTDALWQRCQASAEARNPQKVPTQRADAHPLLHVAHCGSCGDFLYAGWNTRKGVKIPLLKCNARSRGGVCEHPVVVTLGPALEWTHGQFLDQFGEAPVVAVVETPGVDHTPEITELNSDIDELTEQLVGLRGRAAESVSKKLNALSDRAESLAAAPVIPASREEVPTGQTFSEMWDDAGSDSEKRTMLRDAGAKLLVLPTGKGRRNVADRLRFSVGSPEADYAAILEDASEGYAA
ncbi:recombinase family protein [Kitasatospora sp. NPDC101183]|uniref:recombinase family protein n=1 Tax=Kitasatospora sp. NPDC101183 TaxID=3364100 RepID=UPI003821F39D